jgi:hypothetical protein
MFVVAQAGAKIAKKLLLTTSAVDVVDVVGFFAQDVVRAGSVLGAVSMVEV